MRAPAPDGVRVGRWATVTLGKSCQFRPPHDSHSRSAGPPWSWDITQPQRPSQDHLGSPNTAPAPSQPALTGLARQQRAQRVRLVLAVAPAVTGPGGRCRCCRAGRGAHQGYRAAGWCRRCPGSRASSALAHNGGQRRAVTGSGSIALRIYWASTVTHCESKPTRRLKVTHGPLVMGAQVAANQITRSARLRPLGAEKPT